MDKDNYVWFITHTIKNNETELHEEQNAITHTSTFTQETTDEQGNTLTTKKDGFISTISLTESTTYFDITGEKINYVVREVA